MTWGSETGQRQIQNISIVTEVLLGNTALNCSSLTVSSSTEARAGIGPGQNTWHQTTLRMGKVPAMKGRSLLVFAIFPKSMHFNYLKGKDTHIHTEREQRERPRASFLVRLPNLWRPWTRGRVKPTARNLPGILQVGGRDPAMWATTCWFLQYTLAEPGLRARHWDGEYGCLKWHVDIRSNLRAFSIRTYGNIQ